VKSQGVSLQRRPGESTILAGRLRRGGFSRVEPAALQQVCGISGPDLLALEKFWDRLTPDRYLLDGGKYRSRRHGCFILDRPGDELRAVRHRAHWQPRDYNALHGGLQRWFDPLERAFARAPAFRDLMTGLGRVFARRKRVARWYIEAHQFRIHTAYGIGRPTPEGAHRDGVDFVAIVLMGRRNVLGGETRVFKAQGSTGVRFTLAEPGAALLLDDAIVVHETTPIQAISNEAIGYRDTLVLTYRAEGFQSMRGVRKPRDR